MNLPDDFDHEAICRAIAKGVEDAFTKKLDELDRDDDWLIEAIERGVFSAFSVSIDYPKLDTLYDIYEKAVKDSVWDVEDAKARGQYR